MKQLQTAATEAFQELRQAAADFANILKICEGYRTAPPNTPYGFTYDRAQELVEIFRARFNVATDNYKEAEEALGAAQFVIENSVVRRA